MNKFLSQRRLTALLPALLTLSLGAASVAQEKTVSQNAPAHPAILSPQTLMQIGSLEQEEDQRTPAQQKLDSHLWYAAKMKVGGPVAPNVSALRTNIAEDEMGLVLVDIDADVSGALLTQIAAAGGKVVSSYPQYHAIRARVPMLQMESLAGLPAVHFIKPAVFPVLQNRPFGLDTGRTRALRPLVPGLPAGEAFARRAASVRVQMPALLRRAGGKSLQVMGQSSPPPTGSVDSEGDTTHRASLARSTFHADGTGIKIGVISDSDDFLENAQASGDLPSNVTVLPGQSGRPGSGEGTAMMEIVHDIAPGASIYFSTAGGSTATLANNITALYNAGCKIIVDDVAPPDESPFQDSAPAQAVEYVTAHGAFYFSSAGNYGNFDDQTSGAWEGDFVASSTTVTGTGGGKVAVFATVNGQQIIENTVTDRSGHGQNAYLFWADPLGHATNDYNLFVVDGSGAIVDASTNVQNGAQDPIESVSGVPDGDALVIVFHSGTARFLHMDLTSQNGTLYDYTNSRTRGHATVNAVGAYGVAATPARTASPNYGEPTGPYPNPFSSTDLVEFFSSDGPSHQFYLQDGTPITPGNFTHTGGVFVQKPDITAADGVTTSLTSTVTGGESFAPFFGTSAAAPHAAAITALLLSYNPSLTQAQVRSLLTGSGAIDIMATGWDRDSGYGILDAYALLTAAPKPPKVVPTKIAFTPNPVVGGQNTTGTVTLSGAAPSGGAAVTLSENGTTIATLTIAASQTSGSFTLTPPVVTAVTQQTYGASYNGTTVTTTLTVNPAAPTITSFTPTSGPVGTSVTLTGTNFTGATSVKFHGTTATTFSVTSATQIKATVPTGATTGTLSVTTSGGTATSSASFTVTAAKADTTLTFTNPTGAQGQTVSLTARLRRASDGAALSGETLTFRVDGAVVGTASTHSSGQATLSYVIPGNATGGAHPLTASFAGDGSNNGSTGTGTLTVTASGASLSAFAYNPNPGFSSGVSQGTVTLSGPAPTGGASVVIAYNGTTLTTLLIAAGQTKGTYSQGLPAVTASQSFSIGATYNGKTIATALVVNPTTVTLSSFTLSPNPATSGGTLTGTLTLSSAAPAGGATVTITQNTTTLGNVTIAAGSASQTFTVFAPAVTASTVFTYKATFNSASKTVSETVNPSPGLP